MDRTKVFEAASKLASKGQYDKALREFDRVLNEDPRDVPALAKVLELHGLAGHREAAATARVRLAECFAGDGFLLKALWVYLALLQSGFDHLDVRRRLALLYEQLGQPLQAAEHLSVVASRLEQSGDAEATITALQRLLSVAPGDVDARVRLGELHARSGSTFAAIAELRRAFEALEQVSRPGDQRRVLAILEQLQPDDPDIAKDAARSALRAGAPKEALAKLQQAYLKAPKDPELLQLLARTFQELGEKTQMLATLRTLAGLQKGGPQQRTLLLIQKLSNAQRPTPRTSAPPEQAPASESAPRTPPPAPSDDGAGIDLDLADLDDEPGVAATGAVEEVSAAPVVAAVQAIVPPPLTDLLPDLPIFKIEASSDCTSKIALPQAEPEHEATPRMPGPERQQPTLADEDGLSIALPDLPPVALEPQVRDNTAPIDLPAPPAAETADTAPNLPFFPPLEEIGDLEGASIDAPAPADGRQAPQAVEAGPEIVPESPEGTGGPGALEGLVHPAIRATRRVGFL